jgi:signal transduction histidine kinase/CheY-like chemotaxis protein
MGGDASQSVASWHELAVARARDARIRAGFSVVVAAFGVYVARDVWPAVWLAATLAAQVLTLLLLEPMRRDPSVQVSHARAMAFWAGLGVSALVFAAIAPILWFHTGWSGRLFAVMILAGAATNVMLLAGASAKVMWISGAPFILLLPLLPLISFYREPLAARSGMVAAACAALLFALYLCASGRRAIVAARALGAALREAERERLRALAANEAKSEFLAMMSHELRTPLNGVLGMAQALEADALSPGQRERVEVVRQSGEILLALVNDLLDVTEIETGSLELEPGVVDVAGLAEQTRRVFAPLAEAKGLAFRLQRLPSAAEVRRGDARRVRQILHNLVANAVKFTASGRIVVVIRGSADELELEVRDTGPGLAPERLGAIFERFSLSDLSATRRHGGPGLGLAVTRGLARLMGGDITAASRLGEGSVFTARLKLPLAEAGTAADAARPPAPGGRRPVRVLAAEDNPTNQIVLKALLEQAGLTAHLVANGEEAVEAWRAAPWDVVLMDIQMPVMDGLAATRAIRAMEAQEGRPRTPIVAVTANALAHQAAGYIAAGMDGLTPKPIEFVQLMAVIEEALQAHEAPAGSSGRTAA